MKKKITLLATLPIIVFTIMNINISKVDIGNELELSVIGIKAFALMDPPSCNSFGARNWDVPTSFQSGYDCLCKERKKVTGSCS